MEMLLHFLGALVLAILGIIGTTYNILKYFGYLSILIMA